MIRGSEGETCEPETLAICTPFAQTSFLPSQKDSSPWPLLIYRFVSVRLFFFAFSICSPPSETFSFPPDVGQTGVVAPAFLRFWLLLEAPLTSFSPPPHTTHPNPPPPPPPPPPNNCPRLYETAPLCLVSPPLSRYSGCLGSQFDGFPPSSRTKEKRSADPSSPPLSRRVPAFEVRALRFTSITGTHLKLYFFGIGNECSHTSRSCLPPFFQTFR